MSRSAFPSFLFCFISSCIHSMNTICFICMYELPPSTALLFHFARIFFMGANTSVFYYTPNICITCCRCFCHYYCHCQAFCTFTFFFLSFCCVYLSFTHFFLALNMYLSFYSLILFSSSMCIFQIDNCRIEIHLGWLWHNTSWHKLVVACDTNGGTLFL